MKFGMKQGKLWNRCEFVRKACVVKSMYTEREWTTTSAVYVTRKLPICEEIACSNKVVILVQGWWHSGRLATSSNKTVTACP